MEIFAFFMLTGLIATYFCTPETKGKTLEDLSQEDQSNFVKGTNVKVPAPGERYTSDEDSV